MNSPSSFVNLRALLEGLPDPFFALDATWRITFVNGHAQRFANMQEQDLLGRDIWKLNPDLPGTIFEVQAKRAMHEGVPVEFEAFFTPRQVWVNVHAFPFEGGLGVHFRNVTKRKRAEERATIIKKVTSALMRPLSVEDVLTVVIQHALPAMGAYAGSVALITDDGQGIRIHKPTGYDPERVQSWQAGHALSESLPATLAIRENRALFLNRADIERDFPALVPIMTRETRCNAVLPLQFDERVIGALLLSFREERQFSRSEQDFMADMAAQCALALERARLVEARDTQRQVYENVLDQLPVGVWLAHHPSGEIVFRNRAANRLLHRANVMSGKYGPSPQGFHPDGQSYQSQEWPLSRTIRTGVDVHNEEIELERADGTRGWLSLSSALVRGPAGQALFGVMAGVDATQRKRAEQTLQQQTTLLRDQAELLSLADEVIILRDPSDRIITWNAAAEKLYGYSQEEALGKVVHDLLGTVFPESREAYLTALERDGTWTGELTQRARDGRIITVLSRQALRRDAHGRVDVRVSVNWDITARKLAEQQVQELNTTLEARIRERTAQLEALNEELDAFAYSVSHDLRAPVRHIRSFVGLLRGALETQDMRRVVRFVDIIEQTATGMSALIDELLSLARSAQEPLSVEHVNLNVLIDEVRIQLEPEVGERSVTWRVPPLPVVRGDRGLLRQVFMNLLGNAVKYTRPRSEAVIEISVTENPTEHVVHVRDNGVGFDPRFTDKLFGVFQRLHRTEEFEGTGVGLANVKRIVGRHGGTVWATGELDGGATFSFSLPRR